VAGPPRTGSDPGENIFSVPPSKAKYLYTNPEKLTLSCTANWAWPERVDIYNRQMTLPRKIKEHRQHIQATGPGSPFGPQGPGPLPGRPGTGDF
jgi:hypothetical protein